MRIRIKNWKQFQHFKDRRPPWIRLYRYLLDDPEWHRLKGDDAKMIVEFWLLASEDSELAGNLPDIPTIAWRLRKSEKSITDSVSRLSHWVEQDDIAKISASHQDVTPETEERRDREQSLSAAGAATTALAEFNDERASQSPVDLLVEFWNRKADPSLPRVRQLTEQRRRKITLRLKEHPDGKFWLLVMQKINASSFLRGRVKGRSWTVDFDFLIENDTNVVKIAEGRYDDEKKHGGAVDVHDRLAAAQ